MVLVPPELWEKRCQTPSPPPVKTTLKNKDHSYNTWTRVRLQDPYLRTERLNRQPIAVPIIETTHKTGPFLKRKSHSLKQKPVFNLCIQSTLITY
jgi:hypothetical protein